VRQDILDRGMCRRVVILKHEVPPQELTDWRCPFQTGIAILILDQQAYGR